MEYNKDEVKKRFLALPEDLKAAMIGVKTSAAIKNIGIRNQLNVEQVGTLAEIVGLILVGIIKATDLMQKVRGELKIGDDAALKVADEVNTEVFAEIRDSLKQAHEAKTPAPEAVNKEEILKEIEDKKETPEILEGMISPPPQAPSEQAGGQAKPFEEKTKQDVFRAPAQTTNHTASLDNSKYPDKIDPYRELPE